jgi:hypothetical protein
MKKVTDSIKHILSQDDSGGSRERKLLQRMCAEQYLGENSMNRMWLEELSGEYWANDMWVKQYSC